MDSFVAKLSEVLELSTPLNPDATFTELEMWDSLAALNILAMIDDDYRVVLNEDDLKDAPTPSALWTLVQRRLTAKEK
jgi:acyl carrier protein